MYKKKIKINIHHTDAAGVIFHGRIFELTDQVYEDMLENTNFDFSTLFKTFKYRMPVVNCNANFYKPVTVGDVLEVHAMVDKIGKSSFVIRYDFFNSDEQLALNAYVTIVVVEGKTFKSVDIPGDILKVLKCI